MFLAESVNACPIIKSYYLRYCRMLRRVIRRAKLLFYSNMISSKNKPKISCRVVRNEIGKSGRNNQTPTSFKNDNLIINPIQIANAFNDYHINVVDNISSQIMSLLIILLSCCRILSSRFF